MAPRIFCRDLCLESGEPAAGLGASPISYVLLHWPRGSWRVPRIRSHLMPETLGKAILAANASGIHVALVDGDEIGFTHEGFIRRSVTPQEAEELLRHLAVGGSLEGERDERMIVVCCTDGKQDPCCARYGFSTWRALRQAADPTRFRILQSTHLGGCRFAASLVVLPQRARYSRLEPTQVGDFLACLERASPYLPAYRGNPALAPPRQAAELAVLLWAARSGISGDVRLGDADEADLIAGRLKFAASVGGHFVRAIVERVEFFTHTRCETAGKDGGQARVTRWVATSILAGERGTE